MPCPCWYCIILYNSVFVTVCYFSAWEMFVLESKGEGGEGEELGRPLLLFNPLWYGSSVQTVPLRPSEGAMTIEKEIIFLNCQRAWGMKSVSDERSVIGAWLLRLSVKTLGSLNQYTVKHIYSFASHLPYDNYLILGVDPDPEWNYQAFWILSFAGLAQ